MTLTFDERITLYMTEDEFERAIFKGMEDVDADEI